MCPSEVSFTQFFIWWAKQPAEEAEAGFFGRMFTTKTQAEKKRLQELGKRRQETAERQAKEDALQAELDACEAALAAFKEIDADGSGALDLKEIMTLAESLGKPFEASEVHTVIEEMAGDESAGSSTEISFDQFYAWWCKSQTERPEEEEESTGVFGRLFGGKKRKEKKRQQEQEQRKQQQDQLQQEQEPMLSPPDSPNKELSP